MYSVLRSDYYLYVLLCYLGEVWICRSCLFGGRLVLSRPWHLHRDICYPGFYGVHGAIVPMCFARPGLIWRAGRLLRRPSLPPEDVVPCQRGILSGTPNDIGPPTSWKPFQMVLQRKVCWPPITRWSFPFTLWLHFPTTVQTVGMSCGAT